MNLYYKFEWNDQRHTSPIEEGFSSAIGDFRVIEHIQRRCDSSWIIIFRGIDALVIRLFLHPAICVKLTKVENKMGDRTIALP